VIVPGHGLLDEGAPYTADVCSNFPCNKIAGVKRVNRQGELGNHGVSGHGHATCRCGGQSPHLYSGAERRRWHTAHKHELRGEVPPAPH